MRNPALAVEGGLEDNNTFVSPVKLAQLAGRPGLGLEHDAAPAASFDVLAQRIGRNAVIGPDLDEDAVLAELEHVTADHVIEFEPAQHVRFEKMARGVAGALHPIAQSSQHRPDLALYDIVSCSLEARIL